MPSSSQGGGGGPWGSGGGGQSPWGRGTGGPTAPDLEDMLRKGQDRFRRMMPKGVGGGTGLLLVALVIVLVWLATGFYRVQADEQGVVLRFGQFVRQEGPGLHYHLPAPVESVSTPKVTRVNRIDIGFNTSADARGRESTRDVPKESLMLTGDENIIDIDFTVLWRIYDARAFLFNIRNPEETVKLTAESVMREIIGRTDIQPALTEARQQIETDVRLLVQTTLDEYGAGIEITQIQLQKVDPPAQVVEAFNDVLRARQDRQRVRNEAEAYRNDVIPRARGEAQQLIQEAEAYKEQVTVLAEGDASRFTAVLNSYRLTPEVTAERLYLETWQEMLAGVNKVIIDEGTGGGQGVSPA